MVHRMWSSFLAIFLNVLLLVPKLTSPIAYQLEGFRIVGTWTVSSTEYEENYRKSKTETVKRTVTVKCNVCPEIIFKTDGTGTVLGDEEGKNFVWNLDKNILKIQNDRQNKYPALDNGYYTVSMLKGPLGREGLVLINSRKTRHNLL